MILIYCHNTSVFFVMT